MENNKQLMQVQQENTWSIYLCFVLQQLINLVGNPQEKVHFVYHR